MNSNNRGGRGGGRGGGKRHDNPNVQLSKNLAYLLRHGAEKEGLKMRPDGYVALDEILAKDFYKSKKIGFDKIKEAVDTNDKKRFELKEETNDQGKKAWWIRATQGHSLSKVNDEELLEKVTDFSEFPTCIHGTNRDAWALIKKTGLNRMNRNHIHMAIGYPGDGQVISGMRQSCDVYIELDTENASKAGIPFFMSKNKVLLSPGINGIISPRYFKKVVMRSGSTLKEVDPSEYACNDKIIAEESKEEQKSMDVKQDFDYLCVLDFEANCDDKSKLDVQEIIEFPIVLVDTKTLEVVDKFHTYVKPEVHPKLSSFCTELTGITQDKVDNGISLDETLKKADQFLKDKGCYSKRAVFVTCGDWDLSICLRNEAQAKKTDVPEFFKGWINIKKMFPTDEAYHKKYKKTLPGMAKMLELAKLELLGRHHSGIDDSINIARIAIWMMKRGINFSVKNVSHAKY